MPAIITRAEAQTYLLILAALAMIGLTAYQAVKNPESFSPESFGIGFGSLIGGGGIYKAATSLRGGGSGAIDNPDAK